jgi:hypothetical protein
VLTAEARASAEGRPIAFAEMVEVARG